MEGKSPERPKRKTDKAKNVPTNESAQIHKAYQQNISEDWQHTNVDTLSVSPHVYFLLLAAEMTFPDHLLLSGNSIFFLGLPCSFVFF